MMRLMTLVGISILTKRVINIYLDYKNDTNI